MHERYVCTFASLPYLPMTTYWTRSLPRIDPVMRSTIVMMMIDDLILLQVDDMVAERAARRFQQGDMAMSIDRYYMRTGDGYSIARAVQYKYKYDVIDGYREIF